MFTPITRFVLGRLQRLIRAQLVQGLSERDCSRAVATGLTVGVFPILGFSTLINTGVAQWARLNQPIVHAFNWVCGPLKLALIFPFLRLGESLFGAEPFRLSLAEFSRRFYAESWATTVEFAWTFVHAIVGWLVCVPLLYGLLYFLAATCLRRAWHEVDRDWQ